MCRLALFNLHKKVFIMDNYTKELQELYDSSGSLRPSAVLEVARKKTSALHARFEWDDKKAGHQHRLEQARSLIRYTPIVYEGKPDKMVNVRPTLLNTEGEYLPARAIVKTQSKYDSAFSSLMSQVRGLRETMLILQEAAADQGIVSTQKGLVLIQEGLVALQEDCA
jgi:hypothetical protein